MLYLSIKCFLTLFTTNIALIPFCYPTLPRLSSEKNGDKHDCENCAISTNATTKSRGSAPARGEDSSQSVCSCHKSGSCLPSINRLFRRRRRRYFYYFSFIFPERIFPPNMLSKLLPRLLPLTLLRGGPWIFFWGRHLGKFNRTSDHKPRWVSEEEGLPG